MIQYGSFVKFMRLMRTVISIVPSVINKTLITGKNWIWNENMQAPFGLEIVDVVAANANVRVDWEDVQEVMMTPTQCLLVDGPWVLEIYLTVHEDDVVFPRLTRYATRRLNRLVKRTRGGHFDVVEALELQYFTRGLVDFYRLDLVKTQGVWSIQRQCHLLGG